MYEGGTKEWYHALQNRFFDPVLLHCVRTVEGDRGGILLWFSLLVCRGDYSCLCVD